MPYGFFAAETSPDKLVKQIEHSSLIFRDWLSAEQVPLSRTLLISLILISVLCLFYAGVKILVKLLHKKENSLKYDIFHALFFPFLLLGGFISVFFIFQSVSKTFSAVIYSAYLRISYTLITAFFVWGICRVIGVFDRRLRCYAERDDNNLDNLTIGMIGNVLKISVILISFLFIGQNIFEFNITALLASAGVIGLSLALAAKDTVSNFFGTVVIMADKSFRIGDRIESGKVNGIVQSVGMRSSRILLEDESICTVPNSVLTNSPLLRITPRGLLKYEFELALLYSLTAEKIMEAEQILHELCDNLNGKDAKGFDPRIYFSKFGEFSLNIHVIVWLKVSSFKKAEAEIDQLNIKILERFERAGLEFAYPTKTVFVKK